MDKFMNDDFLLNSRLARKLYHQHVSEMPIIDYHNHLSAKEIYENKAYNNLTELWLNEDHYKWRLMRTHGINESLITSSTNPKANFDAFVSALEVSIGNPIYTWTHLELKRYFGINIPLSSKTKDEIYERCSEILESKSIRDFIEESNVEVLCTTDDPLDDLKYHKLLAEEDLSYKVLPTFRPDKLIQIESDDFISYLTQLSDVSGIEITCLNTLINAIKSRIDYFIDAGCRVADHSFNHQVYMDATKAEVESIFNNKVLNKELSKEEVKKYRGYMLKILAIEYSKNEITQQYHVNALRNPNTRALNKLGRDSGFDIMSDEPIINELSELLDSQEIDKVLPQTVIYSLNPNDNEMIATMIGAFQSSDMKMKVQAGVAWWFNDQIDGIKRQIESVAQLSMLAHFIGMTTDSRSITAFTRHEVFRRIITNKIADYVNDGLFPNDLSTLKSILEKIVYRNAKDYFKF